MPAKLALRRSSNGQTKIRQQQVESSPGAICSFCKKNGELEGFYTSHKLRDENDKVQCPVLLRYTCPKCLVTGEHTVSYCPKRVQSAKKLAQAKRELKQTAQFPPPAWNPPDHGLAGGQIMLDQLLNATSKLEPDQRAYFISCMGYSLLRLDLIYQLASVAEDLIRRELVIN